MPAVSKNVRPFRPRQGGGHPSNGRKCLMRTAASALIGIALLIPVVQSQPQAPPQGQAQAQAQPKPQPQPPTRSAFESDPKGWQDLFADRTMKEWIRGPLGAAGQLRAGSMDEPSPWKMDPATGVLLCEGDKVGHEWIHFATEMGDIVYHVEWRLTKVDGEPAYNAGVFIRSSADGKIWHQAQAQLVGGFLFGASPVNGTVQRFNLRQNMYENRVKPAGEWNVYELRSVGKEISLWVNGAVTSEFKECEVPRGFVGLEAEGYRVEYRNVLVKPVR
jgi:3-keto-disaccharide hydrolase